MAQHTLSEAQDWRLVHPQQDIRGWKVKSGNNKLLGEIKDLIFNSDTQRVETVVLDDGEKYPARDIRIGDGEAFLREKSVESSASGSSQDIEVRHSDPSFEESEDTFRAHHVKHYEGEGVPYHTMAPAYRHGWEFGTHEQHQNSSFEDLESQMKRAFKEKHPLRTFDEAQRAIKHGFDHARAKTIGERGNRRELNTKV